jgi:molecular chaperone HtpG
MSEVQKQTLGFQTEVSQLLHLVTHSLYSNKEIFLRELISNASDACDKLRFEAIANNDLYENDPELRISVVFDDEAKTITIRDNGIGMTQDEVIQNLGTIARSGTREFLQSLKGDQAKDNQLIGQFGVGFYSAFTIADRVVVRTRCAGVTAEQAVEWESDGHSEFTITPTIKAERGTEVILHLKKEEQEEFLDDWRLRSIIRKYSDHISFPVQMLKTTGEGDTKTIEWETVNRATALWAQPKNQITDEEYKEFYKHISHDYEEPLTWSHNRVEGKLEYISLLYIPKHPPFDLFNRDHQRGLKLYVKRVFIMDNAEELLPSYLRFVKGVIDSNDLPLNVSREILQSNRVVESIRSAVTKRVLEMLEKMATDSPEQFAEFWKNFGAVLKEGVAEDFANKERIAQLLRFATTHTNSEVQDVTLDDYIARMKTGQDKIYYVTAETFAAAKHSPHLEVFRKKGIEVLLLSDRVDEWLVAHLAEYKGKHLQSVAKGNLDLGELEDTVEKDEQEKVQKAFEDIVVKFKDILKERVKDVRITHRLTESPACIVADENDMGIHVQRMLKAAGQSLPESKPILEVNPSHPFLQKLHANPEQAAFSEWCHVLLDQAILAEGGQLDDPATFVTRLNHLLLSN